MTSELDRQMASPMGRPTMSESNANMDEKAANSYPLDLAALRAKRIADLTARLAAAEAERDAAVARAELSEAELSGVMEYLPTATAENIAEGERRATAAIVADLRTFIASDRAKYFADRYKAGDHLKAPK